MAEKKGNGTGAGASNDMGAGIDSGNNDGNMSVIDKKNQRTLQEIICDVTEQELAQYPDDTMSAAEIEAMIKKRALKTRKRRLRIISAAAVFMIVAIGVFVAAFDGYPTNVEADKNAPQETITDDGVVIEDGGWGSAEDESWTITDWEEIHEVKQHITQLLIPKEDFKGFNFKMLKINPLDANSMICTYEFRSNKGEFTIEQYIHSNNLESLETENVEKILESKKGTIYLRTIDEIKIATIQVDDGIMVELRGNLDEQSILNIINTLE